MATSIENFYEDDGFRSRYLHRDRVALFRLSYAFKCN